MKNYEMSASADPLLESAEDKAAGLVKKSVVARTVNISFRTIEKLQKEHKIPYVKLGARCVRYHLPSVISALRKFEFKEAGAK